MEFEPVPATTERARLRRVRYDEARAFYYGTQWEGTPRRVETRLVLNYARALLRKSLSYMLGGTVKHEVLGNGGDRSLAERVERELARSLLEDGADATDWAVAEDASVLGEGVAKVTWDVDAKRPRATPVDPAGIDVEWSAADVRTPRRVVHAYELTGDEIATAFGRPVASPDKRETIREEWSDEYWRVWRGREMWIERENPYGWIPYCFVTNNAAGTEPWGESDLVDLYDVCRALNKRMSVVSDILDLAGYPIAVLENVDGAEDIRVGPGARWELPEGAKAYLLDLLASGGVTLHIDYIDQLRTTMHDLAETPRTAFGDSGRNLSGVALEVEIQPLVQRVRRKRRAMEAYYQERNARLLDLLDRYGGLGGGLRRTVAVWPPILPSDEEAKARLQIDLVDSRLRSLRSAMTAIGEADPEAQLRAIEEEERRGAGGGDSGGGRNDNNSGSVDGGVA